MPTTGIQSLYEITHWNATINSDASVEADKILPKGIITDLTLPTLERDIDTTKRAGELGVIPRPKFFNEMELTFTVKGYFKEFLKALASAMVSSITIKATTCIVTDANAASAFTVEAKGFVTSLPLGALSADGLEAEVTFMAYYLKAAIGTTSPINIVFDPRNYIFSLDGGTTNLFSGIATIIDPPVT